MFKKFRSLTTALILTAAALPSSLFIPLVAHAAMDTCTWSGGGGDNNFSTAANWAGCDNGTIPEDGDNLIFVSDATANNDLGLLVVPSLTINAAVTITGNDLGLEAITLGPTGVGVLSANVVIAAAATITGDGTLTFGADDSTNLEFLSSSASLTNSSTGIVRVKSTVIGDGTLTQDGTQTLFLSADNSGFDGDVNIDQGTIYAEHLNALGSATGSTTVSDNARVLYYFTSSQGSSPTIAEPFILGSASSSTFDNFTLGVQSTEEEMFTFSGAITLTANTSVYPSAKTDMKLTGALNGSFTIGVGAAMEGKLVLAASPNNSLTANGTYETTATTTTLSDSQPATPVSVYYKQTVIVNGTRDTANVASGGTLKGTGTVGAVFIGDGGTLAPGQSPGCLNSGNLTENGIFQAEIGGTAVCTEYDQQIVTGTVTLGATSTLQAIRWNGFYPAVGNTFTIINNDATDAVVGTFSGMAEAATFTQDGVTYRINYAAGDGNDVVLTVVAVPGTPNTGVRPNGSLLWILLFGLIGIAGSAAILNSRQFKSLKKQ